VTPPVKVTRLSTLTRKVPGTSQCSLTHGPRPAAATLEHDGDQEAPSSDDDDDSHNLQERQQPGRRKQRKAQTFRNVDLPGLLGSMLTWHNGFLLLWFQYLATVNNIWNLSHPEHIATAQTIWSRMMGNILHILASNDEPVFYLVVSVLFYRP